MNMVIGVVINLRVIVFTLFWLRRIRHGMQWIHER